MAAVLIVASAAAASAQDVEKGETSFRKCRLCHAVGENAQNKIGPALNGLDGRHAGTVANFAYSDAHKIRASLEPNKLQGIHQGSRGQSTGH